jgi:hypothetical protein
MSMICDSNIEYRVGPRTETCTVPSRRSNRKICFKPNCHEINDIIGRPMILNLSINKSTLTKANAELKSRLETSTNSSLFNSLDIID